MKISISFYLQHYLSPSMTFIYRQLSGVSEKYKTSVLCSNQVENLDKFPFSQVYVKRRNFLKIKQSNIFTKIYGQHKLFSRNPKLSIIQRKYFRNIVDENNIRLIHAHFGPSGIEILPLAKKLKIPLVVSFHGYDGSVLLNYEDYLSNLRRLFKYAHIIFPSYYMLNELKKAVNDIPEFSVIYYGIPLDKFSFINRTTPYEKYSNNKKIVFLQVSNFVEKKGHYYTIIAFSKFLKFYKNAELILGGDGYLLNEIKTLVNNLGIRNKVIFKGAVNQNQVIKLMSEADIFLHHSITGPNGDKEGIPNVIMEAMATGLPCISTLHAGIPELINDRTNGYLVDEKDVESFVHKMIKLVKSPNNFQEEARETIQSKFNLAIQNEKILRIYDSLLT